VARRVPGGHLPVPVLGENGPICGDEHGTEREVARLNGLRCQLDAAAQVWQIGLGLSLLPPRPDRTNRAGYRPFPGLDGRSDRRDPGPDPAEAVTGYLDIWRRILEAGGFRADCAVTGVITGAHEQGLLDRTAAAFTDATDALAAQFRKVEVPEADAAHRAALLIIAAEGAVLLARAQRSTEPLLLVAEQFTNSQA
jgi:hypothetical protein